MKKPLDNFIYEIISTNNINLLFLTSNSHIYLINDEKVISFLKKNREVQFGALSSEEKKMFKHIKNSTITTLLSFNDSNSEQLDFKSVILPISGKCNLKCNYCFARVNDSFLFDDFTENDSIRIAKYIFENIKGKNINFCFFGGEPFLNFKLMNFFVNYTKENFREFNCSFSITTNGTIINGKHIDFIKKNNIALLVSLDGNNEANKYRVFKNGQNSLNRVLNNIQKLKENKIDFNIRATITNDNKDIFNTFQFFENLQVPFNIVFAYDSENKKHSLSNFHEVLSNVKSEFDKVQNFYISKIKNKEKVYSESITNKLITLSLRKKTNFSCSGGYTLFSICSNGDIYSCEHFVGIKEYCIGNINGNKNLENNKLKSFDVETNNNCQKCWAKYLCSGGCFSSNISSTGDKYLPLEEKCELIREEWRFIISLYYQIKEECPLYLKQIVENFGNRINC